MRLTVISLCAILAVFLEHSSTLRQKEPENATIHLLIVDPAGGDLGVAKVELFKSDKGENDIAARFKDNTALSVPFGIYRLRAYTSGFWAAEREVRVFQPEVWVVMQLEIGIGKYEGGLVTFELSGTLKNILHGGEPIWLRLVGIYSGVALDALASTSGDFKMAGIPQGQYILATRQGNRILNIRPIQVPVSARIEIDLASKTPK